MKKYAALLLLLILIAFNKIYSQDEVSTSCPYIGSVNVITGQFNEAHTDISLGGPRPLSLKRCFYGIQNGLPEEDLAWHFNHPNALSTVLNPLPEGAIPEASLEYIKDTTGRLQELKITNNKGDRVYNALHFNYDLAEERGLCRVEASDGREIKYFFHQAPISRGAPGFVIDRVIDVEGNEIAYSYRNHPTERKMLIKRCDYPEGRYIESEYYEGRHNNVGGILVTIEDPFRDPRIGRIKLQKEPHGPDNSPLITRRFFYHSDHTVVTLANDQKMVYEYSTDHHLTAVKTHHDPAHGGGLYKTERLIWSEPKDREERRLIAHTIENGDGQVYVSRTYQYDAHGNLILEKLYGNITGAHSGPFNVDSKGCPKGSQTDCCETRYEYARKDKESPFYLVKKEEAGGKTTRYLYDFEKGRNIGMLICDGTTVRIRQFYVYNDDGLLIETISDDGSGEKYDDLSNVRERHIARFTLRDTEPAIGMPEAIEECCIDPETGNESLIKRTINHYNQQGKVIQQDFFDAEGGYHFSKYQNFDLSGRLLSKIEQEGNEHFYSYDRAGNKTYEEEIRSYNTHRKISNTYDVANRLIATTETDGNGRTLTSIFRYDMMGNQIASIDQFGNETNYEYDEFNRLIKVTHPEVYDQNDSLIRPVVENRYDLFGNVILTIDPKGYRTETTYNIKGNPLLIHHPDGTQEKFEYFIDGSLKKQTAKNGIKTTYTRDFLGRPLTTELYAKAGNCLGRTKSTYNAFHKISFIDVNGIETCYSYDGAGRQVRAVRYTPQGMEKTEFEYDSFGRIHVQKEWYGEGDSDYSATVTERDLAGNVIEVRIEDASGRVLKVKTENLDEKELLQKSLENEAEKSINDNSINDRGQRTHQETTVDDDGNLTTRTMDALGRCEKIEKKSPFGELIEEVVMRYDPSGNKVKETHKLIYCDGASGSFTVCWKYGPNNRLESIVEGEGLRQQRTTTYRYNSHGQLEEITKPDRTQLFQYYNDQGFPSRFLSSDGTLENSYEYDHSGNIIEAVDRIQGHRVMRQYDSSNRLVSEMLENGVSIGFEYDRRSRKSGIFFSDGSGIRYGYDAANLLEVRRLAPSGERLYTHSYLEHDLEGRILTVGLAGDIGEINYSYGQQGQCTRIHTPFWEEEIAWNGAKEKKHLAPIEELIKDTLGLNRNTYTYNGCRQIIRESGNDEEHRYDYDSLGNRISKNDMHYTVNPINEITYDGKFYYSYDSNGNLIRKQNEKSWCTYKYDALNRLASLEYDSGMSVEYFYDGFGRRYAKKIRTAEGDISTKNYLHDGECEIGTLGPNGEITSLRILGEGFGAEIGAAVAMEFNNKLYIPIHDYVGSVRCLVNASTGEVAEFYRFNAYGEETCYAGDGTEIKSEELINPWRFSSKRFDNETGFIFYGKRYYSPSVGRWLTQDPIGHADGVNRFVFVQNNPKANIDHFGLFSWSNFWNGFLDVLSTCFKAIANLGNKIFGAVRAETEYFEQIRPSMTSTFEKYFGKGFLTISGYYTHPLESGTYGQGEINDSIRITFINGIANVRSYYRDSLELFNKTHGGINVHYIFRPTEGLCWDFIKAFLIKMGYISPYARELATTWKSLIAEMGGVEGGGSIIHYCHSLGGSDTITAASLLTPEERRMIKVVSFGSASVIPDDLGFAEVTNYVSVRDGICLADPIGYFNGLVKDDKNVVFIGSLFGVPLIDHSLSTETYSHTLTNLGNKFMQMYAYSGGFY